MNNDPPLFGKGEVICECSLFSFYKYMIWLYFIEFSKNY